MTKKVVCDKCGQDYDPLEFEGMNARVSFGYHSRVLS